MPVSFSVSPEETALILQIVDRAEELAAARREPFERRDCAMDLTATHANGCPLDFQALLDAPEFDFRHDIGGISRHLDRTTGKLGDGFTPRCALPIAPDPLRRALEALENGDVGDATEWIEAAIEERGQAAPAAQGTLFAVMCNDRDSGSPYDLLLAKSLPALLDQWVPVIFTDYKGNPLSVAEHRQEIEAMFPEGLGNLTWERARELATELADRDNERTYFLAQPDVGEWAGLE